MPLFDAVSLSSQTTTTTLTWSHTTTTTANRIGIVSVIASTAIPSTYSAFTWGGVAPNIYFSSGGSSGQLVGVWFDPPTGTQTISCGVGGSTPMRGQAVTYSDVVGFADVNRLLVSSTGAKSVAVTAVAGQTSVFVGQLAAASGAATWASTNGTIRTSHTAGATNQSAGFISEQTGTGTVTGSSTAGGTVPSGGIVGFVLVGYGQEAAFVSGYYALGTGTHSVATTPGSRSTTSPLTFNAAPVAASDAYTVAVVQAVVSTGTNANATMTATWGGVAMTQQSLRQLGATTSRAALATFTLANPGTGTKSVVVTAGAVTTSQLIAGTAVFRNVSTVNNATSAATAGITVTSDATSAIATGHVTANTSGYTAQANKVPGWVSVTSVTGTGDGFIMMLDAGAAGSVTTTPGGTATTPGSVGINLVGGGKDATGTIGASMKPMQFVAYPPYDKVATFVDDFSTETDGTPITSMSTDLGLAGVADAMTAATANSAFGTAYAYPGLAMRVGLFDTPSADTVSAAFPGTAYDFYGSEFKFQIVGSGFDDNGALAMIGCGPMFHILKEPASPTGLTLVAGWPLAIFGGDEGVDYAPQVDFSYTTHKWLRVREDSGDVYWEASTDGTSWDEIFSASTAAGETYLGSPLRVVLPSVSVYALFGAVPGNSYVIVDNINVSTATTGTIGASLQKAVAAVTGTEIGLPIASFIEPFDGTLSTANWDFTNTGTGSGSSSGGSVTVFAVNPGFGFGQAWLTSDNNYDLQGSEVIFGPVSGTPPVVGYQQFGLIHPTLTTNGYTFYWSSTTIRATKNGTGIGSAITHTAGNYYRIRESGGTVYWDYSTNKGVSWTNMTSSTTTLGRALRIQFEVNAASSASSGTLTAGGVNVIDPAGTIAARVANATNGIVFAGSGGQEQTGTIAALMQQLTVAGAGEQAQTGSVAAALQRLAAAASGGQAQAGAAAAVLQRLVASLAGDSPTTGTVAAVLLKATAALSGVEVGQPIANLVDVFTGVSTTPDTTLWSLVAGLGFGTTAVDTANDLLTVNGSAASFSSDLRGITSKIGYDLQGSQIVFAEIGGAGGSGFASFSAGSYTITLTGTNFQAQKSGANVGSTSTFTGFPWLRIQETGGTVFYDKSANGVSWTNFASTTATVDVRHVIVTVSVSVIFGPGTYGLTVGGISPPVASGAIASRVSNAANGTVFAGSGAQGQSGSAAAALQKATFAGAGGQTQTGTVAAVLQMLTTDLAGTQIDNISGALASTFQRVVADLAGGQVQSGAVAAGVQLLNAALAGTQSQSGAVAATMQYILTALAGEQVQSGAVAATMQRLVTQQAGVQAQAGAAAAALQQLTAALAGEMNMAGTVAASLRYATAALSGAQLQTGALASTMQILSMASVGGMLPSGAVAAALQQLTMQAQGVQAQSGAVAAVLQYAVAAASGEQTQSGAAAMMLQRLSVALSGAMNPSGSVAAALQYLRADVAATQAQSGVTAASLQRLTTALSGVMSPSGAVTATLQYAAAALAGSQAQTSTIAATLQRLLTVQAGEQPQSGAVAAALADLDAALSGVQTFTGTLAAVTQLLSVTATGAQAQTAVAAAALQPLTVNVSGALQPSGAVAAELLALRIAAVAAMDSPGEMISAVRPLSAALAGVMPASGAVAAGVQFLNAALLGSQTQTGVAAVSLQRLALAAEGAMNPAGTIAVSLRTITALLAAEQAQSGAVAVSLQRLTAALAGAMHPSGVASSTLQPAQANLLSQQAAIASVSAALQPLAALVAGEQSQSGTAASVLQRLTVSATGAQIVEGSLAATLRELAAALTGAQVLSGSAAATLAYPLVTASGLTLSEGSLGAALRRPLAALLGAQTQVGSVDAALMPVRVALAGVGANKAVVAVGLLPLIFEGQAENVFKGAVHSALPAMLWEASGEHAIDGVMAPTLQQVLIVAEGEFGVSRGAIAASLWSPLFAAEGYALALSSEPFADRLFVVKFQSRMFQIRGESRTQDIARESRVVEIGTESRILGIREESRTQVVT